RDRYGDPGRRALDPDHRAHRSGADWYGADPPGGPGSASRGRRCHRARGPGGRLRGPRRQGAFRARHDRHHRSRTLRSPERARRRRQRRGRPLRDHPQPQGRHPDPRPGSADWRTGYGEQVMRTNEVIRTEGLRKEYVLGAEVVRALRGIDLLIERNEYVAIMGPSGSGKSTFMNLIRCLDMPTAGEYWLNGTPVSKLSDDDLARIRNKENGFVFQTCNLLLRATALHKVELPLIYAGVPAKERRERAATMLEKVGLAERMEHKPNELSGGQRQRVAVARALVNNPALLLADEPTGNLDTKTSEEIMALFGELHAEGQTIVLVTHEPDIAEHAHRQIVLRDGQIERDVRREYATREFSGGAS